jgi:hypothetical protein
MSNESLYKKSEICRVCKGKNLEKVLSLGSTPPANAFLKKEDLGNDEPSFPLELFFCKDCSFVQLGHVVSQIFYSVTMCNVFNFVFVSHFKTFAGEMINGLV